MATLISICVAALFGVFLNLIGDVIEFFYSNLTQSNFSSLEKIIGFVPELFGVSYRTFLSTLINLSIVLCVIVTIIAVTKSMFLPAVGKESDGPIQITIRMVAAIIMILCYQFIWDFLAGGLNKVITSSDFFSIDIGSTLSDAWTLGSAFDANYLLNAIFYISILVALIGAGITHIERYLSFALFMMFGPICIAFYPAQEAKSLTSEWFKGVIAQSFGILLSFFFLSLFGHSIASTGVLNGHNNTYTDVVRLAVMLSILSVCKNSEQFLNALGLRTMPSGDTFRQFAAGVGTSLGLAKGAATAGSLAGNGYSFSKNLKADGGFANSFMSKSAQNMQLAKTGQKDFINNKDAANSFGSNYAIEKYKRGLMDKIPTNERSNEYREQKSQFFKDARAMAFGNESLLSASSYLPFTKQGKYLNEQWDNYKKTAQEHFDGLDNLRGGKNNVVSTKDMNKAFGMDSPSSTKKFVSPGTQANVPIVTRKNENGMDTINVEATRDLWSNKIDATEFQPDDPRGQVKQYTGYIAETETKRFDGATVRQKEFVFSDQFGSETVESNPSEYANHAKLTKEVGTLLTENGDFGVRMNLNTAEATDERGFSEVKFSNEVYSLGDTGSYSVPLKSYKESDTDNATAQGVSMSNMQYRMDPPPLTSNTVTTLVDNPQSYGYYNPLDSGMESGRYTSQNQFGFGDMTIDNPLPPKTAEQKSYDSSVELNKSAAKLNKNVKSKKSKS